MSDIYVTIRDADFKVISRCVNLSGLLRHARRSHVVRVDIFKGPQLGVTFADGATCITSFADRGVLRGWIAARVKLSRGWALAEVIDHATKQA